MANPLFDNLLGTKAECDMTFIIRPDGRTVTYAEFHSTVARFALALRARGVTPGDRVTSYTSKSVEGLALYFATVGVGAIFTPLNSDYTADELKYFLEDARPALVVCDPTAIDKIATTAEGIGAKTDTLSDCGTGTLIDRVNQQTGFFSPAEKAGDDTAAILYTSGTTGRSKGAMLTHDNLLSNAIALVETWQFTSKDVLLHALPVFHAHGLFVALNTIALAGGSIIFHPKFSIDDVVRDLPKATSFMGVPTFYTRLISDGRLDRATTKNMRLFTSGSAPLLAETHREFEDKTGHRILERYGMTETTMITSNPYDGERKPGSVGLPLPRILVRICDEASNTVEDGQIGVLQVKGPNVFKGYWKKPEKTAEEFTDDGYFGTGDLARLDTDGYIEIIGREKDLIISGGYNVYPKEIELLIDSVPGVSEAAVFGVPHPDFGEAVVAAIVPDGVDSISGADVLEHIGPKIARFKKPKHVEVVSSLPRNAMGKVQKNELRNQLKTIFA